jgi:tetratricopeptide (TPR) repeat protein
MGEFARAYECFDEALLLVKNAGSPVEGSILVWQSAVQLWQGRWPDAIETAQRAQRIAEQVASVYVLAMSQATTAYAQWRTSSDTAAIDLLLRATSWLDTHEKHLFISINYAWLAEMLGASGREREARAYVARTLRRARMRDRLGAAAAYRITGLLPWNGSGKSPEAYLECSRRAAAARGSRREQALTLLATARVAAARGRTNEAIESCARARAEFAAMGMSWYEQDASTLLVR